MKKSLIETLFKKIRYLLFDYVGQHFRADTTKQFSDKSFALFEKIAVHFELLSTAYISLYEEIVQKEIKLAKITHEDRILIIGGGTIPVTPTIIASQVKSEIVAIDNDIRAVKCSRLFINRHSQQHNILIELASGETYPIRDFDVIIVVYGIKNARDVLEHLSEHIGKDTRVLFRTTYLSDKQSIIENIDLSTLFSIKTHFRSASLGQVDSFLLAKKRLRPT